MVQFFITIKGKEISNFQSSIIFQEAPIKTNWWWILSTVWLTKERRLTLFPAGKLSEILTIANLWHSASSVTEGNYFNIASKKVRDSAVIAIYFKCLLKNLSKFSKSKYFKNTLTRADPEELQQIRILHFPYSVNLSLSCRANQWTGFCMITASVLKGLSAKTSI